MNNGIILGNPGPRVEFCAIDELGHCTNHLAPIAEVNQQFRTVET